MMFSYGNCILTYFVSCVCLARRIMKQSPRAWDKQDFDIQNPGMFLDDDSSNIFQ